MTVDTTIAAVKKPTPNTIRQNFFWGMP